MKRREFVAVSSGATVAAGVGSPGFGSGAELTEPFPWIGCVQSVVEAAGGFRTQGLDFSELTREQRVLESGESNPARPGRTWEVVPACKLAAAEGEWATRGAVGRFFFLPGSVQRMTADLLFEPFHGYPFRLCAYDATRSTSPPPPIRQNIPVDARTGVNVRVQLTGPGEESRSYTVHFSADEAYGAAQLGVGVYAVAFSEAGVREIERLADDRVFRTTSEPVMFIEFGYGRESDSDSSTVPV